MTQTITPTSGLDGFAKAWLAQADGLPNSDREDATLARQRTLDLFLAHGAA